MLKGDLNIRKKEETTKKQKQKEEYIIIGHISHEFYKSYLMLKTIVIPFDTQDNDI